jgi:predicted MFS family arabinose efflux permease
MAADRGLLALCCATMVLATASNFLLGTLAPFLVADSVVTVGQIALVTAVYYITAIAFSSVGGRFADARGGRTALASLLALQAIGMLVFSVATGAVVLALAVAFGGLAQSLANPTTNRLIARAFPGDGRAFALGAKQAGVPLAALLAGALAPATASRFGWRAVLVGVTFMIGVVHLASRHALRGLGAPRDAPAPARTEAVAPSVPMARLNAYALLMGVGTSATTTYVVLHAVAELGFGPGLAGALAAEAGLVGGTVRLLSALSSERGGTPLRSLRRLAIAAALGATIVALSPYLGSASIWVGVGLLGASVMGWQGAGQIAVVGAASTEQVGSASGVLMRHFFLGQLAGPVAFGGLLALTDGYLVPWLLVAALALGAVAVMSPSNPSPKPSPAPAPAT